MNPLLAWQQVYDAHPLVIIAVENSALYNTNPEIQQSIQQLASTAFNNHPLEASLGSVVVVPYCSTTAWYEVRTAEQLQRILSDALYINPPDAEKHTLPELLATVERVYHSMHYQPRIYQLGTLRSTSYIIPCLKTAKCV